MRKLNISKVRPLIAMAIAEDLGRGDTTSELLFKKDSVARAIVTSREEIVVCGMDVVREILRHYDRRLGLKVFVNDGRTAHVGCRIAAIEGPLRAMLSAERVVLNFLQKLSGIATTTRKYVRAVQGTKARIYDTRKTTPGWRILEKYAVRCGGGVNHRSSLADAALVKDNHVLAAGGVVEAFRRVGRPPDLVLCDGQGYAHPRRFGLACHVGLALGVPTVGCAKSRLVGEVRREPAARRGGRAALLDEGERIGTVLRTRTNVKPVFVSVGHRIDLVSACRWVLACALKYRLPEPSRLAHRLVTEYKRELVGA
jgi:hypothetical protein